MHIAFEKSFQLDASIFFFSSTLLNADCKQIAIYHFDVLTSFDNDQTERHQTPNFKLSKCDGIKFPTETQDFI